MFSLSDEPKKYLFLALVPDWCKFKDAANFGDLPIMMFMVQIMNKKKNPNPFNVNVIQHLFFEVIICYRRINHIGKKKNEILKPHLLYKPLAFVVTDFEPR